jgi:hypothetical protein
MATFLANLAKAEFPSNPSQLPCFNWHYSQPILYLPAWVIFPLVFL